MAIIVKTSDPAGLLKAIRKAIDDKNVVTWAYDTSGKFTHDTPQWKNKALLEPYIPGTPADEIRFLIRNYGNVALTDEIYAIYHGRFIEMLLAHFRSKFQTATATAQPLT